MRKIDRTGEEKTNTFGSLMRIINYRNCNDIDVYFEKYEWTKKHTSYSQFTNGTIACVYEPRVYGVGYSGKGKYKVSENGKHTKCYKTWYHMLERCYDPKYIQKHPSYKGCKVSDEWHNFQLFSEWYYENYYKIEGQRMDLDKDILCKGNKIYSPDTCVFVPQAINKLFTKNDKCRGDLPIGVYYSNKKYNAQCNTNETQKYLGRYDTKEEAFQVYKQYKERYIKEVAKEYKDKIPSKLYEGMMKYKVEIND